LDEKALFYADICPVCASGTDYRRCHRACHAQVRCLLKTTVLELAVDRCAIGAFAAGFIVTMVVSLSTSPPKETSSFFEAMKDDQIRP